MRLFFAVEIPADVRAALGSVPGDDDGHVYRWVDPSLFHVTLAFLGEQPEARLASLETVGREAAAASRGGGLSLGQAGHFGAAHAPRVLWVDLGGDLALLTALRTHLTYGLRQAGLPTEDRPFRPHITLARRREHARGGPPAGWPPPLVRAPFAMHTLTLMHSRLSPRGPTYTPLFHVPIGS